MTVITLKQRFNNSLVGKQTLQQIKNIQKKHNSSFDWSGRQQLNHTDMVSLKNVLIDEKTQRPPFEKARVRKLISIAKKPCPFHFKRIILSQREDGDLVCVEGQGRCLVAYAMGVLQVPCEIYQFPSIAEEVAFFTKQSQNVHSVTGWNKHHVVLNNTLDAKYNQAYDLEKVVTNCGLFYDPSQPNGVDATSSYHGIRDSMLRFEPTSKKASGIPTSKAGQRTCEVTIGITKLMIKYGGNKKLKGNLFYPFSEFVLQRGGKNHKFDKALKELDMHLSNLQTKLVNKPIPEMIDIDIIFDQIGLTGESNKTRNTVWKAIKKW